MSEEQTVEQMIDEAATKRAVEAGLAEPAKVEDKGEATAPASGEDDSTDAGKESEAKADELEASEDDDSQDGTAESEDEGEKPKAKPQSRAQKRIRQLTRERDRANEALAQREAELAAFARLAQNQDKGTKPDSRPAPNEPAPPKQEDFGDDFVGYLAAVAAHASRKEFNAAMKAEREAAVKAQEQARAQDSEAKKVEEAHAMFAKGREAYDDYDEVAASNIPVTPAMADTISESENGYAVLYHLGNNPEEAERISRLSPLAQIREVAMIEARLTPETPEGGNGAEPKPKPAARKTTSADPPLTPVKPGGSPNNFDPDTCDIKDYMEEYQRRIRQEGVR